MSSWNLIIDVARCHDCNDCFLADKDEFVENDFPPYSAAQPWHGHRWMNIERGERGQYPLVMTRYLPKPCMHCDDAPCLTADGAVYKRDDGLVIIDPVKAKGRREIVDSCPYGAIYWNEEAKLAQKCTGCAHLIDAGWTETRCSQVCPTGAIRLVLGDEAAIAALVEAEELEVYQPELGTQPRVYYKNLFRWTKAFIGANVVLQETDEVAEGARMTVSLDGAVAGEGVASNYGDVIVDRLEPGKEYEVSIAMDGYETSGRTVALDESRNLGTIFLDKAAGSHA
jgi:Fe-S-cluster-containing dehydrogenase component